MHKGKKEQDIVQRWEGNPIIKIEDLPFQCNDVLNAGTVKIGREYILLVVIEGLEGRYFIYRARSNDGYNFKIEKSPFMSPSKYGELAMSEEWGVLDPRVVLIEGIYYITYGALGSHGYRLGLARTKDFKNVERMGIISTPDTKGGALFSRKIGGKFARLERPSDGNSIWISYSNDMEYWGWAEAVMTPRAGFWDWHRIGAAVPPIEIKEGWLLIYYGVKVTSAGPLYRLGAAILDLNNPAMIVGRTNIPILSPREEYERIGDVSNLVFSCGAIVEPDNEVKLYYGASKSCICVGKTYISHIVDACLNDKEEF